MPNFLASVGNAELYENVEGVLRPFATAKSITNSAINFTSSSEEIRQGEGAKLVGKQFGSTGMTVSLTDAMFNLKYIAGQVGRQISRSGSSKQIDQKAKFIYDEATQKIRLKLAKEPMPFGAACGLRDHIIVWYKKRDCTDNRMYAAEIGSYDNSGYFDKTDGSAFAGIDLNKEYTIYSLQQANAAKTLLVGADCCPRELVLIITTNLYAGDESNPESGTKVGQVTIKIPRFQLDGNFDLSSAMTSASDVKLDGTALYSDGCNGCNSKKGVYAEITEVIFDKDNEDFDLFIKDFDVLEHKSNWEIGEEVEVYVRYIDGEEIEQVDSSELTWSGNIWGSPIPDSPIDYNGVIRIVPTQIGTLSVEYKNKKFDFEIKA